MGETPENKRKSPSQKYKVTAGRDTSKDTEVSMPADSSLSRPGSRLSSPVKGPGYVVTEIKKRFAPQYPEPQNEEEEQSGASIEEEQNEENETKEEVKQGVKETTKTAAKQVTKVAADKAKVVAAQVGSKILAFIVANPWVLAVATFLVIFVLILFTLTGEEDSGLGYYDHGCNFNETVVVYDEDEDNSYNLSLEEFVLGVTYTQIQEYELSENALRALLIINKTNILSLGNYNSSEKTVRLDYTDMEYSNVGLMDDDSKKELESAYSSVANYLYLSSSYKSKISYLGHSNYLELNDEVLSLISTYGSEGISYSDILNKVYNQDENDEENTENVYRENIFIGDSRTNGMRIYAKTINESNTVYGEGYGYKWFVGDGTFNSEKTNALSGAINAANSKMSDDQSYNIVIWLGVNDLNGVSADTYFSKYSELATGEWSNHVIYVVPVGPVDDSLSNYVKNSNINAFNSRMNELINESSVDNLRFVNMSFSINKYDDAGLHYSTDDYKTIYNDIMRNVDNNYSNSYTLYDMNSYCTYFTITNSEAYWWPIGSKNPTSGDIYAGAPTTVTITSYYGMRSGVYEDTRKHKGIDIGRGNEVQNCEENVIIATKAGKVIATNDTCPSVGSVGDTCGNGQGNYVKIEHSDGTVSIYAHMTEGSVVVSTGDHVKQGQKLGLMGSSGSSTGCHLHFELRLNGTTDIDPLNFVSADNPRPISASNYSLSINSTGDAANGKEYVCKTLLNSGFSKNAVAGIMVNMNVESGFKSTNLENKYESILGHTDDSYTMAVDNKAYTNFVYDKAGYGLIQWTYYTRKQKLLNYANGKSTSIGDITMQLEYFLIELENNSETFKYVMGNYDAQTIADKFCYFFERPQYYETHCPARAANYTKSMLNYVENGCS